MKFRLDDDLKHDLTRGFKTKTGAAIAQLIRNTTDLQETVHELLGESKKNEDDLDWLEIEGE